jgi:hypothetical protein
MALFPSLQKLNSHSALCTKAVNVGHREITKARQTIRNQIPTLSYHKNATDLDSLVTRSF